MWLLAYLHQDNVRAGLRKPNSNGLADTPRSSCDEGRLSFE